MPTSGGPGSGSDPSIKRDLQATADLLDALQRDPALLEDPDFIRRLSILRQKHEETTNFLARKVGAPPLPITTKREKVVEYSFRENSCHFVPVRVAPPPPGPVRLQSSKARNFEASEADAAYHGASESSIQVQESNQRVSGKHNHLKTRATSSPNRRDHRHSRNSESQSTTIRSSNNSSRQSTVREILSTATNRHLMPRSATSSANFATSSVAMPSGLLLSNTLTKHIPRHSYHNLATSSQVVEESFLEDGLSTTREVPTIVDEIVGEEEPVRTSVKFYEEKDGKPWKSKSKSMQNVKTIENTYAKKFMSDLIAEKKQKDKEAENELKKEKFKAKPVPKSTYLPTNTFATELKYVEAMRKKVAAVAKKKFDVQNEMVRSKSEGNLTSIKPLGYVPPSTYISPIPVKPNARSRSATTRSAILIQEATTPKGIKSHRATSNLNHHLRHGRCTMDTTAVALHRRISPPDFHKLHAKIDEEYRRVSSKPTTVPMPFKFASRSKSASSRHSNCQEKEPEQFKNEKSSRRIKSAALHPNRVPSTHAAQLREELNRAKVQKENSENAGPGEFWKDDNRRKIASFLGARSKTEEDIAIRTRRKIQQQQETAQDYMRQLAQMKQRVLNGPLIMEKQSALAQEHRLKRKFELRMKSANKTSELSTKPSKESRRNSETSAAGTFIVEKEYEEDFEEEEGKKSSKTSTKSSKKSSKSSKSSESASGSQSESDEETSEPESDSSA
ncbi:unnamed protein product [Caenorhabditis sp. 36 PRJEB53466]|nr:unnamed protein product [Caenorhabditis sp. 36 PRJEB53466]